uniref:hypothetical protein n=1 Tax=Clostridium sp. NkU-1 TaxID=1095009 RepID=UPI000A8D310E
MVDFPGDIKGEMAASDVCFRLLVPVGLWLMVPEKHLIEAKEWMKQNFFPLCNSLCNGKADEQNGSIAAPDCFCSALWTVSAHAAFFVFSSVIR